MIFQLVKKMRSVLSVRASAMSLFKKEALTQLAFEPATVDDVDTLVAFERKIADPRIYGPALDV
jgi:hypothetical protein